MKVKWMALVVVLCAGTMVTGSPAASRSPEPAAVPAPGPAVQPTLSTTGMEGLRTVRVTAEDIAPVFSRQVSLSSRDLKIMAETYLRGIAGLRVVDEADADAPLVYVGLQGLVAPSTDGRISGVCYSLTLHLEQNAFVVRPDEVLWCALATTWYAGKIGSGAAEIDTGYAIKRGVVDTLREFENEYLKANPDVKP